MKKIAVYCCDTCNVPTLMDVTSEHLTPAMDPDAEPAFPGQLDPLGVCALIRETHSGEEVCQGTVSHQGYTTLSLVLPS